MSLKYTLHDDLYIPELLTIDNGDPSQELERIGVKGGDILRLVGMVKCPQNDP